MTGPAQRVRLSLMALSILIALTTLILPLAAAAPGPIAACPPAPQVAEPPPSAPKAEPKAAAPEVRKKILISRLSDLGWYERDAKALSAQIQGFLDEAKGDALEGVHALILPHAGYRFSGATAAHGIRKVAGRSFRRVVVMGPSHRVAMENVSSVPDSTHYATPLGEIPLDVEFLRALRRTPMFRSIPAAHDREHSVQIELPLLQRALGEFRLVPIVVGQLDLEAARRTARALLGLIDEETLIIASSDFTHYGPNYRYVPFSAGIPEKLRELDLGAFEPIRARNAEGFTRYVERTGATICGRNPVTVLLSMLPEGSEAHMLAYDTSGRIIGDYRNSVSYLAIAFTGKWTRGAGVPVEEQDLTLSARDQELLLKLARAALGHALEHGTAPTPEQLGIAITPAMRAARGAFVTLEKEGRLRGCIGDIYPVRALYRSVIRNALNAAFNDRRFPQLEVVELAELHIEISALTPPRAVASSREIVIGRHGIVLAKDDHRAVYLPQVAPAQGWTLEETLGHLSVKAGLPPEAWREGASFMVFEAKVFGEDRE